MTVVDCTHPRANHQHGTHLAFSKDGCHCGPCTKAHRRHCKQVRHNTETGGHTYTDPTAAREHVQQLLLAGLTFGQIEARSGVHRTATKVLLGVFPNRGASKRITKKTEAALLAVTATHLGDEVHCEVDATGTRRRMQALIALGWSGRLLQRRLGMSSRTLWCLLRGMDNGLVHASTRANVAALYDELSLLVPPAGRVRTRARNIAQANGWLPPLAWDDDTLDDPMTGPAHEYDAEVDVDELDEIAIERRMAGDRRVKLTAAEADELVRRWTATDRPLSQCQEITGINVHRVMREAAVA